jgi:DNA end-binding protein Ku
MTASVWNGSITVSLLNVPIKLVPGQGDGGVEMHMYRSSDASRIRQKYYAEADGPDGPTVAYADTQRGYEAGDGSVVLLDKTDIKAAYGDADKVGKILMFTHIDRVPRAAANKSYLIKPNIGGERTYSLLVAAMQASGKVAVLEYFLRDQKNLAMIYVKDNYLVLEQLRWAEDVRKPDFAVPENSWSAAEVKQAVELIDTMTDDFDYSAYTDEGRVRLGEVVQEKIQGGQATAPTRPAVDKNSNQFANVMDGIAASLAAAKANVPAARKPRTATRKKVSA